MSGSPSIRASSVSEPEEWDPIVDPIREIRMRISAEFGHDLVFRPERITAALVDGR